MSVRVPKYRHHEGSGQALVQINRERIFRTNSPVQESPILIR